MESASNSIINGDKKPLRETIDLENMTNKEKYLIIKDLVVWHPRMIGIYKEISECHKNCISSTEPECMTIIGPTHVGKSEVITQYVNKHPRFEKENEVIQTTYLSSNINATVTHVPVLRVNIPCPASSGAVINAIFDALGHPITQSRGKNYEKERQLKLIIQRCGVELIIFDEVQHFIDRKSHRLLMEPSDWLKSLIISLNIPIILVGTPESKKIFDNAQLRSRFKNHADFLPFNYFIERDQYQFRKILQILDDELPLKKESKLADDNIWERIYIATNGKLPFVADMIKRCVNLALENDAEQVNVNLLSHIYLKHFYLLGYCEGNPFEHNFNLEKAFKTITIDGINDLNQPSMNNRISTKRGENIFSDL